jgi:hypothetical protein
VESFDSLGTAERTDNHSEPLMKELCVDTGVFTEPFAARIKTLAEHMTRKESTQTCEFTDVTPSATWLNIRPFDHRSASPFPAGRKIP